MEFILLSRAVIILELTAFLCVFLEGRSWAAQALLLRHYCQSICVGRMNKEFYDVCLQIGDFRSFSEVGRVQEIKEAEAFTAVVLLIVITYYLVFASMLECVAAIFSTLIIIGKLAPHLETNSALVSASPNLLLHTLLSYFTCPYLNQVGPALLSIPKAPYNFIDIIHGGDYKRRAKK